MISIIERDINIIIYFLLPIVFLGICQESGQGYQQSKKCSFHKVCILSKIAPKIRIHKQVGRLGRSFSLAFKDDPEGVDHNFEVQGQGDVFNVQQIKLAALHHFFNG